MIWPMACQIQGVGGHGILQTRRSQQEAVQAMEGARDELVDLHPEALEPLELLRIIADVEAHEVDGSGQQPRHRGEEEKLRHGLEGCVQGVAVRPVHQEDALHGFRIEPRILKGALDTGGPAADGVPLLQLEMLQQIISIFAQGSHGVARGGRGCFGFIEAAIVPGDHCELFPPIFSEALTEGIQQRLPQQVRAIHPIADEHVLGTSSFGVVVKAQAIAILELPVLWWLVLLDGLQHFLL
mmetsp:Transcript_118409/g.166437  ORF Transcript_118409/g.166437 Transcript_118409/m.166437 type:complete len:240 (-) Transcript_118409:337-1056(-)